MKMKTVLKGHARPKWKEEIKMKIVSFYICCFSMSCRVVSCRAAAPRARTKR